MTRETQASRKLLTQIATYLMPPEHPQGEWDRFRWYGGFDPVAAIREHLRTEWPDVPEYLGTITPSLHQELIVGMGGVPDLLRGLSCGDEIFVVRRSEKAKGARNEAV